jgi:hypothetical protein
MPLVHLVLAKKTPVFRFQRKVKIKSFARFIGRNDNLRIKTALVFQTQGGFFFELNTTLAINSYNVK